MDVSREVIPNVSPHVHSCTDTVLDALCHSLTFQFRLDMAHFRMRPSSPLRKVGLTCVPRCGGRIFPLLSGRLLLIADWEHEAAGGL